MIQDKTYQLYIRDISGYPRITAEREAELSRIIFSSKSKAKRESALSELVQANLKLVLHCLKEFSTFVNIPEVGISYMDLIAEGNIALMNAARKFNVDYNADDKNAKRNKIRFSSYACKSIKCGMRRALKRSKFIHIPENHFAYWSKIAAIEEDHNDCISDRELVEQLDITRSKLKKLRHSQQSRTTMLEDIMPDEDAAHWSDCMEDVAAVHPEYEVQCKDLKRYLIKEMRSLPKRTQRMLFSMFLGKKNPTLADLSARFGVSKERCRQICARGLQILKNQIKEKWAYTGDLEAFGLYALSKLDNADYANARQIKVPVNTFTPFSEPAMNEEVRVA